MEHYGTLCSAGTRAVTPVETMFQSDPPPRFASHENDIGNEISREATALYSTLKELNNFWNFKIHSREGISCYRKRKYFLHLPLDFYEYLRVL